MFRHALFAGLASLLLTAVPAAAKGKKAPAGSAGSAGSAASSPEIEALRAKLKAAKDRLALAKKPAAKAKAQQDVDALRAKLKALRGTAGGPGSGEIVQLG